MGKFGVAILGTSCPTNLPEVTSWRGIQGQPIAQKCILGQIISIQSFTMKLDGLMVIASDHKWPVYQHLAPHLEDSRCGCGNWDLETRDGSDLSWCVLIENIQGIFQWYIICIFVYIYTYTYIYIYVCVYFWYTYIYIYPYLEMSYYKMIWNHISCRNDIPTFVVIDMTIPVDHPNCSPKCHDTATFCNFNAWSPRTPHTHGRKVLCENLEREDTKTLRSRMRRWYDKAGRW
jgi:hypothetical protein